MTLSNPLALLWGLLAVPLILLYLRPLRLPREQVAAGMIWDQALAAERGRSAWRPWRRGASLAVQLVALGLVVVALADPQAPRPRRVLIVLDDSASMGATDVGPTRLAAAKAIAHDVIDRLHPGDCAAIVAAGDPARAACPPTADRKVLQSALDSIAKARGTTRIDDAIRIAAALAWPDPNAPQETILVSDGFFDPAAAPAGQRVQLVGVGTRAGNCAVTRLEPRRDDADPSRLRVLVEVANFSDEPAECDLTLTFDDRPVPAASAPSSPITLAPGQSWQQIVELAAPDRGTLCARIDRADAYPDDNVRRAGVAPPAAGQSDSAAIARRYLAEQAAVRESDLRPASDWAAAAASVAVEPAGGPIGPLWLWLAAAGVLVLAIEWCLYQRRWTD